MTTGAATQVFSQRFDKRFCSFPPGLQRQIESKIDDLGRRLGSYPHTRMQGVEAFRLRVGDYRIIYQFDLAKNILHLIAVGHRRDVYENLSAN